MSRYSLFFLFLLLLALIGGCVTPGCPPNPGIRCFFGYGYGAPPPGAAPKLAIIRAPLATDEPEATPEPAVDTTPEPTPIVIVSTPTETESDTWIKPEHIIVLVLGIGLAFSHPPQTGKLFGEIMKRAQEQAAKTPSTLDDAIVAAVNAQIRPRLDALDAALAAVTKPPDDNAVG